MEFWWGLGYLLHSTVYTHFLLLLGPNSRMSACMQGRDSDSGWSMIPGSLSFGPTLFEQSSQCVFSNLIFPFLVKVGLRAQNAIWNFRVPCGIISNTFKVYSVSHLTSVWDQRVHYTKGRSWRTDLSSGTLSFKVRLFSPCCLSFTALELFCHNYMKNHP